MLIRRRIILYWLIIFKVISVPGNRWAPVPFPSYEAEVTFRADRKQKLWCSVPDS
jgi:hypothetical protein